MSDDVIQHGRSTPLSNVRTFADKVLHFLVLPVESVAGQRYTRAIVGIVGIVESEADTEIPMARASLSAIAIQVVVPAVASS